MGELFIRQHAQCHPGLSDWREHLHGYGKRMFDPLVQERRQWWLPGPIWLSMELGKWTVYRDADSLLSVCRRTRHLHELQRLHPIGG
jgi:hypothetical protein